MPDRAPSSALRDLRDHMLRPGMLAVMLGVAAVLALAGPFGTGGAMAPLPRFAYWLGIVPLTYATGFLTSDLARRILERALPGRPALVLAALGSGLAIAVVVLAVGAAVFGRPPRPDDLLVIWAAAALVTLLIELLFDGLASARPDAGAQAASAGPPALLDRLPLDRRGALVALTVEDHYVRVTTTRGEALLLMRLTDAIREARPTPGLRVHRSHWVATGQVAAARRRGDGAVLTLATGGDIPVSRSHMGAVKAAGLLSR